MGVSSGVGGGCCWRCCGGGRGVGGQGDALGFALPGAAVELCALVEEVAAIGEEHEGEDFAGRGGDPGADQLIARLTRLGVGRRCGGCVCVGGDCGIRGRGGCVFDGGVASEVEEGDGAVELADGAAEAGEVAVDLGE